MKDNHSALAGIRVLDLAHFTPGPMCAQILGDLRAEVIKIERPGGNDDRQAPPLVDGFGVYYALNNRDKKTVTLNLKTADGQNLLRELVLKSDVLIENFRPGFLASHGLDYRSLSQLNPRLIMVSVTGYGQTGPYSQRGGFDMVAQAVGGIMALNGEPDGPPLKTGTSTAAVVAGLNAAVGVLAALQYRQRTGDGQWLDIALLDNAVAQIEADVPYFGLTGKKLPRVGNRRLYSAPANAFKAADGYVYIAPGVDSIWRRLCTAIGRPEMGEHPDFSTNEKRLARLEQTERLVQDWIADKQVQDVVELMEAAEVPCGAVNDVDEVMKDPQVLARDMIVSARHPRVGSFPVPGQPLKLSKSPAVPGTEVLDPGRHNEAVLRDLLGHTQEEISAWRASGVV
ncbi:MAG TPA: CoA transferase [Burkholderiaceae bacterium]|nr:CoA transferase [Burkholderiaceae bacterium]